MREAGLAIRYTVSSMGRLPRLEFLGALYHVTSRRNARQVIVAEGQGGATPWEQVQGKIYLGSEAFVARHQPDRLIAEVPRRQPQAQRPSLAHLFPKGTDRLRNSSRRHATMGIAWWEHAPFRGALCHGQPVNQSGRATTCVIARPAPYFHVRITQSMASVPCLHGTELMWQLAISFIAYA